MVIEPFWTPDLNGPARATGPTDGHVVRLPKIAGMMR
jgi:hypothetical protein